MSNEHTVTSTAPGAPHGKSTNRQYPVPRSPRSYRPGQRPAEESEVFDDGKKRRLWLYIPLLDNDSANSPQVAELITTIANLPQLGIVCGHAHNKRTKSWEIEVELHNEEGLNEDDLLSSAFRKLDSIVASSPVLRAGFDSSRKPAWKFMRDAYVADEGGFA
jgi:hypothetical protein